MELIIRQPVDTPDFDCEPYGGVFLERFEYYTNSVETVWQVTPQAETLIRLALPTDYRIHKPNPHSVFGKFIKEHT